MHGNHSPLALRIIALLIVILLFYQGMRIGSKIEINVTIHKGESSNAKLRGDSRSPLISIQHVDESDAGGLASSAIDNVSSTQLVNIDDMIPDCAQNVFITLHNDKSSSEPSCRGMLIRDDIILTTRECSRDTYRFGWPVLSAVPHTILNNKLDQVLNREETLLGFLKVEDADEHYYFIDESYYRTRMFLSLKSTTGTDDDGKDAAVIITCDADDEHKPIAHNFPAKGGREMIPLHELYGVVPDDILWEHIDLYTAPTLKLKHERWWRKAIRINEDEDYIKAKFSEYRGPPGSVSIPDAHFEFVGKAAALCEALDPRGHRRGECFNHYYTLWREEQPFSGMHFFDWLDHGDGKHILETNFYNLREHDPAAFKPWEKDMKCMKKTFDEKTVHYFNDNEKAFHEVYVKQSDDGTKLVFRYKNNDEIVPDSDMDDPHLYMWDLDKKFYIVDKRWNEEKFGTVKHTSVFRGMPALSAGKAYFDKDGVWGINFSSGHYVSRRVLCSFFAHNMCKTLHSLLLLQRPDIQALAMMYQWAKDKGFNTTSLHWVGRESWSEVSSAELSLLFLVHLDVHKLTLVTRRTGML